MPETQIPAKLAPLLQPRRIKIVRGGRGAGKSHSIAAIKIEHGWQRPIRWLFAREVQRSIRDSVHRLLVDKIKAAGLESHYQILDTEIRGANGTQFLFRGLRNETLDSIKSLEALDGVWIEEAQSVSQRSLDILPPTIRKPGSEIWASYNPELETDPIHILAESLLSDPYALVIDIGLLDNPWATPELLEMRRRAYLEDPVKAQWIWGGGCRLVAEGAIYEKEIVLLEQSGRLANVPYQPEADTIVGFDLGIGDHTSLVIRQDIQNEIHVVDCYESQDVPQSHYIDWLKRSPYRVDYIALPHDGSARSKDTGRSIQSIWEAAFPSAQWPENAHKVLPRTDVETRIDNARSMFSRLWIDKTRCKTLVQALRKYRRVFNDDSGRFEEPLHDGYSDMADAFGYCLEARPRTRVMMDLPPIPIAPGW